jgi:hypothetical protein
LFEDESGEDGSEAAAPSNQPVVRTSPGPCTAQSGVLSSRGCAAASRVAAQRDAHPGQC